jgi:hypothetical protein
VVFAVLAVCFAALRSHNLSAVDGAVRAFVVYHHGGLEFHGNSHMLYPVYVLLWSKACALLGFDLSDPFAFIRAIQAMNSVFAAASATLLYLAIRTTAFGWARALFPTRNVALFTAAGWAFSHAVLLHATNSAEPVVGMFWSALSFVLVLYGLQSHKVWPVALSGVSLALAMASYQSMVLIGLAGGVLTLLWQDDQPWRVRLAISRAAVLTISFVTGLLAIYGTVYALQGSHSLADGLHKFLAVDSPDVYGGFRLSKFVNLISGFTNNVIFSVPTDFAGLRSLLREHRNWIPWFLLCAVLVVGVTASHSFSILRNARAADSRVKSVWISCCAALFLCVVLLCYWDPMYDKLWLLPLWLLALMAAISANGLQRNQLWLRRASMALVLVASSVNLVAAIRAAHGPWPDVDEARRLSTFVQKNDLVVTDWNSVSVLYRMIWAPDTTFDFPSEAHRYRAETASVLRQRMAEAERRGGSVYFLGILDQPQSAWDPFLGARCQVPYDSLQEMRKNSVVIASFVTRGGTITLRRVRDAVSY